MQIRWSGLAIVEGRGSIGGNQVSRNISGSIASVKTIPTQRYSPKQGKAKGAYRTILQAWVNLSLGNQIAWDAAAALPANQRTNSVGEVYQPTGQSLFIECNLNVWEVGTLIETPAANPTFTNLNLAKIDIYTTPLVEVIITGGPILETEFVKLFVTGYLSPGKMSYKQPNYRFVQNISEEYLVMDNDITARFVALNGAPVVGQRVFIKGWIIDLTGGYKSAIGNYFTNVVELA